MTYLEAQMEAARRWGEGDHLFNVHLYYLVGPQVGSRVEQLLDDGGGANPEKSAAGRSWEEAFTAWDRWHNN